MKIKNVISSIANTKNEFNLFMYFRFLLPENYIYTI